MKRIMIVDDDPHILELLRLYFEKESYEVTVCPDGETALQKYEHSLPDVLLLDLMLPGKSGFDVLRELRRFSSIPILILTARGDTLDKVVGLELGADDYVEKPFDTKELIARVKAVLRRAGGEFSPPAGERPLEKQSEIIRQGSLTVDKNRYTAMVGDIEIEMPPKELELLYFLASYPNRVFSREQLLEHVWDFDYLGETRTIDVHIKRLREKLDRHPHPDWMIKTVWSVGYKFERKDD